MESLKAVCFSGHRQICSEDIPIIESELHKEVLSLIKRGYTTFICGGAIGFDTISAQIVLKIKKINPNAKLILVLPCLNQNKYWNKEYTDIYENILSLADQIIYTSHHYFKGCMHKRNRQMVDLSDICICYLKQYNSGTAHTVSYAQKQGIEVINLALKSLY